MDRNLMASIQPHLLQHLPVGLMIHSADGHLLFANDQAARLLGLTAAQQEGSALTCPVSSFLREDGTPLPQKESPASLVLADGRPVLDRVLGFDHPVTGARTWLLTSAFPDPSAPGDHGRVVVTFTDVTARKQAEARQQHLTEVLRAIRNVNQLITQERNRDALLRQACELLTETRGYRASWIGLCDNQGRVHAVSASGTGPGFEALRTQIERGTLPPCCRQAMDDADAVVRRTPTAECGPCPLAGAYRDTAVLIGALRHAGRTFGVLAVSLPAEMADDAEERSLFHEVTGDLAFALNAMETEASHGQAETALRDSETRFRALFQQAPLAMGLVKQDGTIRFVNDCYTRLFGYTIEDVPTLAEWWCRAYPDPAYRNRAMTGWNAAVARAISEGHPVAPAEFEVTCKDGSVRTIEISGITVGDDQLACFVDLTTRKHAEVALQASMSRLEAALASMTDAVFISDADGRFIEFNDAFATFHRFRDRQTCATSLADYPGFLEVFLPDGRLAPLEQWAVPRALRGETVSNAEYALRRKDTGDSWVGSYSFSPIRDQAGAIVGSIVVARDITEQKQAERKLLESQATYRSLFMNIMNSVVHARIIFDHDAPVDMEYIATNPAFAVVTGISEPVVGRRISAVLPGYCANNPESLQVFGSVATTGIPLRWEHYLPDLDRWFSFIIYSPAHGEVVIVTENISERKKSEAELRASEERFRTLIENAPDGIFVQRNGLFQFLNPAAVRLFGAERAEDLIGSSFLARIAPEDHDLVRQRIASQLETGASVPPVEMTYLQRDGTPVPVETTAVPFHFQGDIAHLVFARDTTERHKADAAHRNLEAQLRQAQKMESVGRLAGGVAHDFNNLLMGIMNYADMVRDELPPDHPVRPWLDEITADAQRSAAITRQLLAFARKQTIAPTLFDLNDHVAAMLKLLQRLIGEDIRLSWLPGQRPAMVRIDPSQVDQILANLAVNARDAIAGVGELAIETGETTFDDAYCAEHAGFLPGSYVVLTVSDTGCGMDKVVLDHLFEPFFTTKAVGQGTGLGLATVYGITRQNNGFIHVYSEPGNGTTFRIYLPRHAQDPQTAPGASPAASRRPIGSETVLLVEDERSVRLTAKAFLVSLGYTVLAAESPQQALDLAAREGSPIHLLVTDVVLPGMNGRDLARVLLQQRPELRCIYMSGYTADVIAHRGVLDAGVDFLCKPFSRDQLAHMVRTVLDRPAAH